MSLLHLNLRAEYFDQIKVGEKHFEFRLQNAYWEKRLVGRTYTGLLIKKGYPRADDQARIIKLPWRGFIRREIQHPHFGDQPVSVFAIRLSDEK